jgi:tetratricopeptide (TPR) repeat protein
MKYAPAYSAPYMHMTYLLFEKGKFDELVQLLEKALTIGGVQKSLIYNKYGRMYEVSKKFRKAVKYYKIAIRWAFNEQDLNLYKDNIRRCREKRLVLWF